MHRQTKTHQKSWYQRAARPELAQSYERTRDLPGLLGLWPHEIADMSVESTRRIITRLEKALRQERRRGVAAHWSYDLNRHMRLTSALKGEKARLKI